jgi:hypothetical protein
MFVILKPRKPGKPIEYREIHDLRAVNLWLQTMHFRSDRPDTVQDVAPIGDFATKLDIQGAFQHVRVCKVMRAFLCFAFLGAVYAYRTLPFGARLSPKFFTEALGFGVRWVRHTDTAPGQGLPRTGDGADLCVPPVVGLDDRTGKVRIYSRARRDVPRLAVVLRQLR